MVDDKSSDSNKISAWLYEEERGMLVYCRQYSRIVIVKVSVNISWIELEQRYPVMRVESNDDLNSATDCYRSQMV